MSTLSGIVVPAEYEDGSPAGLGLVTEYAEEFVLHLTRQTSELEQLVDQNVEVHGDWGEDEDEEPFFLVRKFKRIDNDCGW